MDKFFQAILLISSLLFTFYVTKMIRKEKLQLNYSIIWLFLGISFILLSLFPQILYSISNLLNIKEPVNALFLIIVFFLILILFSFTVIISKMKKQILSLSQEVGILEEKFQRKKIKEISEEII
ncbi:DUF2304 domain-containing protein [Clostridium sp.]|uniref:DUF2304 domain-containing protein n=1 Tax=Clostridium sp. TaxID=1506 RepID=UPI0039927F1C